MDNDYCLNSAVRKLKKKFGRMLRENDLKSRAQTQAKRPMHNVHDANII